MFSVKIGEMEMQISGFNSEKPLKLFAKIRSFHFNAGNITFGVSRMLSSGPHELLRLDIETKIDIQTNYAFVSNVVMLMICRTRDVCLSA